MVLTADMIHSAAVHTQGPIMLQSIITCKLQVIASSQAGNNPDITRWEQLDKACQTQLLLKYVLLKY